MLQRSRRRTHCFFFFVVVVVVFGHTATAWSSGRQGHRRSPPVFILLGTLESSLQSQLLPVQHQQDGSGTVDFLSNSNNNNNEIPTTGSNEEDNNDIGTSKKRIRLLLQAFAQGERSIVVLPPPPIFSKNNIAINDKNKNFYYSSSGNTKSSDNFVNEFCGMALEQGDVLDDWRIDALALQTAGFGSLANVVVGPTSAATKEASATTNTSSALPPTTIIRAKVHQIWLQSPAASSSSSMAASTIRASSSPPLLDAVLLGRFEARRRLLRLLDQLRLCLQELWLPADSVEVSYVVYDSNGAYYSQHVDVPQHQLSLFNNSNTSAPDNTTGALPIATTTRRAVSVILYLGSNVMNDNENDEEANVGANCWTSSSCWDPETDGGALRIFGQENVRWVYEQNGDKNSSDSQEDNPCHSCIDSNHSLPPYRDIAPIPGTIVLFDSLTVPHAVLPTKKRGRVGVVAWFGTSIGNWNHKITLAS